MGGGSRGPDFARAAALAALGQALPVAGGPARGPHAQPGRGRVAAGAAEREHCRGGSGGGPGAGGARLRGRAGEGWPSGDGRRGRAVPPGERSSSRASAFPGRPSVAVQAAGWLQRSQWNWAEAARWKRPRDEPRPTWPATCARAVGRAKPAATGSRPGRGSRSA